MIVYDNEWTSTGSSGALTAIGNGPANLIEPPMQTALYCEQSTVAATNSFSLETAAHSTGPWAREGSTSVGGTATVTGAAVLRLTGPWAFARPYLNSASTGNFTFRLIASR